MSRLIDADALEQAYDDKYTLGDCGRRERDDVVDALRYAPTVDAVPVVHGEWILQASGRDCKCSVCESYWIPFGDEYDYKYCPNCGARMDGERREG